MSDELERACRPASVISPRASRAAQRCLLSSVQWLRLRRGERRCASLPSGRRFKVESIQPKHNASSTTSIYGKQAAEQSGRLLRYMAIQHSFASSPCFSSQLRNWSRWVNSSKSVISIKDYFCEVKSSFIFSVAMCLVNQITLLLQLFLFGPGCQLRQQRGLCVWHGIAHIWPLHALPSV